LRCFVVSAKGACLSVARVSSLRCWNHSSDQPIVLSVDLEPRGRNYDLPPSIVWCGSLTRSRTVRAVWIAGGERRYSRMLALVDFVSRRTTFELSLSARNPVG